MSGYLFFVGMTGVGKTELAKALAELIFRDEDALIRFDMSEYAQEHSAEKFTGAPPGFVGYEEGGLLTNAVRKRPQSVILFDELDKCHPKIYEKFISILEDGRLTDGKGDTAYFNQSILIFTSNIGTKDFSTRFDISSGLPSYEQVSESFKTSVADFINNDVGRPELKGRLLNAIIPFDILRPEFIEKIAEKFVNYLIENIRKKYDVEMTYDVSSVMHMVNDFVMREALGYGGRGVKMSIDRLIVTPLCEYFIRNNVKKGAHIHIYGSDNCIKIA